MMMVVIIQRVAKDNKPRMIIVSWLLMMVPTCMAVTIDGAGVGAVSPLLEDDVADDGSAASTPTGFSPCANNGCGYRCRRSAYNASSSVW